MPDLTVVLPKPWPIPRCALTAFFRFSDNRAVRHNPMRVYKFLDEHWGLEDIAERHVKVSTFADMNDPFELIGSRWADSSAEGGFIADFNEKLGAMCLSRNCTDPLLWAHYADKHRGICLGIDIPDDPVTVNHVIYTDGRELMDRERVFVKFADGGEDAGGAVLRKLRLKYIGWDYEEEVRLLKKLENGLTFFCFNDDDFILRQVILGLRSRLTKQSIVNRLSGFGQDVEILKATLSPDEFRIVPRPIDECASS